jgi:hypothetical protein
VPSPFNLPPHCRFEPRCPFAWERCSTITPELFEIGNGRRARCHLHAPGQEERRRRALTGEPHVASEEGGETLEHLLADDAEPGGPGSLAPNAEAPAVAGEGPGWTSSESGA